MGYRSIPATAIAVGKATSQLLWKIVRGDFISHESRLVSLEGTTNVVPTGFILKYAGSTAPTGFLLCDGTGIAQSAYPDLYAIIGTSYGNPGGGLFSLPDFRGRTVVGSGTGSGLTARTVGATGGAETHPLVEAELPAHTHTVTDPQHRHLGVYAAGAGALPYWHFTTTVALETTPTKATDSSTITMTIGNAGSGTAHNNMQPSLVVNFLIKT